MVTSGRAWKTATAVLNSLVFCPTSMRSIRLNASSESYWTIILLTFLDSSEELMGKFWLGQFSKRVIKSKFEDSEGPEAVGSSHGDFGFVVEPFDNTAGELLMRLEVIEDELAMLT